MNRAVKNNVEVFLVTGEKCRVLLLIVIENGSVLIVLLDLKINDADACCPDYAGCVLPDFCPRSFVQHTKMLIFNWYFTR
jgi:hypothetical protein